MSQGCQTALLHDARWDIIWQHCRLPSLEQVSRLAADWREEATRAHGDDTENSDDDLEKLGFAWITRPHAIGARGLRMSKSSWFRVKMMTLPQPTLSKCTLFLRKAWIPISKVHELGSQLGSILKLLSVNTFIPAAGECVVSEFEGEKLKNACKTEKNTSAPGADVWRFAELKSGGGAQPG